MIKPNKPSHNDFQSFLNICAQWYPISRTLIFSNLPITSTKSHFSLQSVEQCNFTPLSRTSWFFIPVFVSFWGRKIGISLSVILNFTLKPNLRGLNCSLKLGTVYMHLSVHPTTLRFKGRVTENHSSFRLRELNYPGIISKSFFNPLNPGAFCQKGASWTFWCFWGSISVKLPFIRSKMPWHHNSLAFLPLASQCATFCLGHAQKSKFLTFFFGFSFFSFSFLFPAVIDLLLGLLAVKKLLGKRHRDGQLSPWSSPV